MHLDVTLRQIIGEHGRPIAALDSDSRSLRLIADVKPGLKCNCICPMCQRRLIAKKGSRQTHHFAHRPDEVDPACARAGETLLHLYAKNILDQHKTITFPGIVLYDRHGPLPVTKSQKITFEHIQLEKHLGGVIPDVVAHIGGRQLFIEFKVTHKCPPEKLEKLRQFDVGVLEIDLSGLRDRPLSELHDAILHEAPRTVLQSRVLERAEAALKKREADYLGKLEKIFQDINSNGVVHHVPHHNPFLSLISVPETIWKNLIMEALYNTTGGCSYNDLVTVLIDHNFLQAHHLAMESEIGDFIRDTHDRGIFTIKVELMSFLIGMESSGKAYRQENCKWFANRSA